MLTYPILSVTIVISTLTSFNYDKNALYDSNYIVNQSALVSATNTDAFNKRQLHKVDKTGITNRPANSISQSYSFEGYISNHAHGNNHPLEKTVNNTTAAIKDKQNSLLDKQDVTNSDDIEAVHAAEHKFFTFNESEIVDSNVNKQDLTPSTSTKSIAKVDYWQTVYSIESKQGKLLYRPGNKSRNCTYTTSPCGHHQLTVQALKDIGCKSLQCRKDRLNYTKSLEMSKKLLAKNEKRLKKNGYENLDEYQRYLIHQQGAAGIKTILAATKGKKLLSKKIKKNMASNSPYSYKQLRRMGSKLAARKFMQHWQLKWENEKRLIAATTEIQTASNTIESEPLTIPAFSDNDIKLALNYRF